jgi:hypothetical protein
MVGEYVLLELRHIRVTHLADRASFWSYLHTPFAPRHVLLVLIGQPMDGLRRTRTMKYRGAGRPL